MLQFSYKNKCPAVFEKFLCCIATSVYLAAGRFLHKKSPKLILKLTHWPQEWWLVSVLNVIVSFTVNFINGLLNVKFE